MALQFNPPPGGPAKTGTEGFAGALGGAVQQIPSLLMQYEQLKRQRELSALQHENTAEELKLRKREFATKYGTGAPAPTTTTAMPSNGPGSTLAASPMLDPMATVTTKSVPETAEQLMERLGTEGLDSLTKAQGLAARMAGKGGNGPKDDKTFSQENQLRTQYLGQVKDFKVIRDAYKRIQDSATDPSAAGDLALIFNYMKVLDPGSTVREGEFANAQNAAGIPERIRAQWNKVINGERLTETTRKDFVGRAGKLYDGQKKVYKSDVSEFRRIAEKSGLDPDDVIIDLLADALETPPPVSGAPLASPASAAAPSAGAPAVNSIMVVESEEQYNGLPSGAQYKDSMGNTRRKK